MKRNTSLRLTDRERQAAAELHPEANVSRAIAALVPSPAWVALLNHLAAAHRAAGGADIAAPQFMLALAAAEVTRRLVEHPKYPLEPAHIARLTYDELAAIYMVHDLAVRAEAAGEPGEWKLHALPTGFYTLLHRDWTPTDDGRFIVPPSHLPSVTRADSAAQN